MGVLNTVRSGLNVLFTPVLYGVVASLALQLTTWEKGDRTQDKLQDKGDPLLNKADTFDFIVVGGGTAGSVLANRLSGTSERYSVLLLEAGGEPNPLVYVPGLASHLLNRPEVDWMYKTVAQKRGSQLAQFKRTSWSSGKGLGGSGNLDWMVNLRGSPKDYDNWAKLVGDPSWGYKNFLSYFQRHENFVGNTTDPEAHASGGELTVQLPHYRPLAPDFVWAGKELGYPNVDLNGRFSEGFDEIYYPSKRGEKQTTYKTFVEPIKRRENLTIRKFATVTKLLLRKTDNGAYGLEYERHGQKYSAYAQREIILCAGSIQSPKILLASGIGPTKHLEDVGIKPVLDLPVGRNLQDHVGVFVGPFFVNEPMTFQFDKDVTAKTFFEYGTYGQGPLTTTGFQAAGMISSSYAKLRGEKGWPDLMLLMHGVSVHGNFAGDMAYAYGLQEEPLKKYYKHAVGKNSFHIVVTLGRPYARGEVRLASRNPTAPLIIDPKYFEDPWEFDAKTLVEGVKKAVDLVESTQQFGKHGGRFTEEKLPGCQDYKFRSDKYWECYIRQYTISMNNPVGTCTMGPLDSPHAVVDSELRVIGSSNLRVIDGSVMPSVVSGGTQPAIVAVAEKGAESILLYWKDKNKKEAERDNKLFSESEIVTVRNTPLPPTQPPTPTFIPPPSTSTTQAQLNFLKSFGLQTPRENTNNNNFQQNWQNTLDSLAQFSKTIQETLKVPLVTPPTTKATTTTKITTTKPVQVQSNMFHTQSPRPYPMEHLIVYHDDRLQKQVPQTTPRVRVTTSSSPKPPPSTSPSYRPFPSSSPSPRPIQLPYVPNPTQVVVTPSSSRTPLAPTTFRPTGYNTSDAFTYNVPSYKHVQSQTKQYVSHPIKIYNSSPKSVLRKEQYQNQTPKPIFILPPPTQAPTTKATTTSTTPLPVTTRRPLFEMIQSEILPPGYENLMDIPISSVEYLTLPSAPIPSTRRTIPTTTTSTTTTTTPRPPPPRTQNPMRIIPAIQMEKSPLETTTTRITFSTPFQTLIHGNRIQTIPENVFLSGLEQVHLIDVTTATEHPQPTTSPKSGYLQHVPLLQEHHHINQKQKQQNQYSHPSSKESPIYYVVRKKNKEEQSQSQRPSQHSRQHHNRPALHMQTQHQRPYSTSPRSRNQAHQHSNSHQSRQQSQRQRQSQPQQHTQRQRQPQSQLSSIMLTTQAQHFPVYVLPQRQSQSQRRHHFEHTTSTESSPFLRSRSTPRHRIQRTRNRKVPGSGAGPDAMDGIITPAISGPMFQQNVLNQLIPVI